MNNVIEKNVSGDFTVLDCTCKNLCENCMSKIDKAAADMIKKEEQRLQHLANTCIKPFPTTASGAIELAKKCYPDVENSLVAVDCLRGYMFKCCRNTWEKEPNTPLECELEFYKLLNTTYKDMRDYMIVSSSDYAVKN